MTTRIFVLSALWLLSFTSDGWCQSEASIRLGSFQIDATIPTGHRCMGVLPQKSKSISDSLELHGFVLLGHERPIVIVAIDWCEIRNRSYDLWRERLAKAVGTDPSRVLVSCLHQHDAPVIDHGAQELLDSVELSGELFDNAFHESVLKRAEEAARDALQSSVAITRFGYSEVDVREVASNRRVVDSSGKVTFARGSSSGRDLFYQQAPAGEIDAKMRTISFWNGEHCVLEYHAYATHPMSFYGRGEVSSDFVGLARKRRQREDRATHHIYASGCSGDVTAGKYNDGSLSARESLTQKIYEAMVESRKQVKWTDAKVCSLNSVPLMLEYSRDGALQKDSLTKELQDTTGTVEKRILAAMGLASWDRAVEKKIPIDMACVDLGIAKLVLFPGESFVGYQAIAQRISGGVPVIPVGYGESWTGYVPTEAAFKDGFHESWLWVAPGAQQAIEGSLKELLGKQPPH